MSGDSEGWQVARRRKGKFEKMKLQVSSDDPNIQEHLDVDKIEKRLRQTVSDLTCEAFYEKWKDELLMAALGIQQFQEKIRDAQIELSDCLVFDPVFSSGEKDVLKRIGLTVLTENELPQMNAAVVSLGKTLNPPCPQCLRTLVCECVCEWEGKRQVDKPTIFYLMHCGKALYNNLLWKNWSKHCLTEIIIIGNSFCSMKERTIDREFNRDYSYISQITAVCKESLLPCPSHMIDVFSDTAVITFPTGSLNELSESTWVNTPEPQYEHCADLEIVCKDQQR
ncbi:SRR1-like protein isoform X3 [Boleophthalmus pectinirostris]|uniref:SRR1-like protein isoform X3 n=1 Tax=Boleophthalmus pectinirostris TaxID=150288 RepID=UPI00242BD1F9|nr:SRR1-like protein isoform X3 [Boleophthalmus pectinirostris]